MAKGKLPETPNKSTVNNGQKHDTLDLDQRRHHLEEALVKKGVLKQAKSKKDEKAQTSSSYTVKLSSEFLAAIVVGIVLGLGFDKLVGTNPWGLVVFLFLGFAAGVMNVLRSVGMMDENSIIRQNKDKDKLG